jgi:hypothetical protein
MAMVSASFAALLITTHEVEAFNCPSGGSTTSQKDAYNNPQSGYNLHGWLGYCQQSGIHFQYYGGEDSRSGWGGPWQSVSYMSIHMRVWVCGNLNYDQTQAYNGAAYDQLVSQQFTGCLPQADVSGYETVTGSWSWSWYLNY